MRTLEEIKNAIGELPRAELAKFRAWFEGFDAAPFDRRIEQELKSGKFDKVADKAVADFKKGRFREL